MIAAEPVMAKKSLRIKITSQRIEVVSGTRSCQFGQQLSLDNEWGQHTSPGNNFGSQMGKSLSFKEKYVATRAKKRGPFAVEDQQEKRQKMERSVTQQCSVLLKALMHHPAGWVFNKPVDPVKLSIPDYFTIVKNPMDLGTIKSKLEKNLYLCSEEFAADVRLTFSNATLYNPRENSVHQMAVELKEHFETRWKSLVEKWSCEGTKLGSGKFSSGQEKEITDPRQNCPKTPSLRSAFIPKKSKSLEEKTTWHSSDVRCEEENLGKPVENYTQKSLEQYNQRGTDQSGRHVGAPGIEKMTFSAVPFKCGKCGLDKCQCGLYSDSISTHTSSDLSVEGSLIRDHHACGPNALGLECQPKSMPSSQMNKSDPDSDGAVSALDHEIACPSSQLNAPSVDGTSEEGWKPPVFDVPLSPTKALRAAILKQRFAATILKAQHKTLLDHGDRADPVKMQQERERLERRQQEEKARIEAQIRAAEAASRTKKEMELKMQREKEREAARVALQKMEKTVDLEQNIEVLKELEMLCGCSLSYKPQFNRDGLGVKGESEALFGSPLARLGLYIKDDAEDEYEANADGEEGEILIG